MDHGRRPDKASGALVWRLILPTRSQERLRGRLYFLFFDEAQGISGQKAYHRVSDSKLIRGDGELREGSCRSLVSFTAIRAEDLSFADSSPRLVRAWNQDTPVEWRHTCQPCPTVDIPRLARCSGHRAPGHHGLPAPIGVADLPAADAKKSLAADAGRASAPEVATVAMMTRFSDGIVPWACA